LTWCQNKQRRQQFLKRGGSGSNAALLPDFHGLSVALYAYCQTIILLGLSLEVDSEISVGAEVAEDIAPIKYYGCGVGGGTRSDF
jgi:hypothetical protein